MGFLGVGALPPNTAQRRPGWYTLAEHARAVPIAALSPTRTLSRTRPFPPAQIFGELGRDASLALGFLRPMHAYLIFSGAGPILALSTYRALDDERLREKLRFKGITRYMAYEVDLQAARKRYPEAFDRVAKDLEGVEDLRVLDYNGHQIMANFRLAELGAPVHVGE